ncbi:Vacuolar protein sorting-associated protein 13 [Diplodia seriata]|uniref:Vacuolar protein sorting-associated protein 13 n=1 Tax=Diplodia seriata TaxID=420778 RepID=A0A1S8BFZ4_9PEZI|nr:Vacuolar protein sorting-associated protein 13 [Diplodia seriata]
MLEGLVANLLNRFLGMYVQNFDPKQLNVGIWSGDVKLRDLELRREALDQLHLPLNVVQGHLGSLTLSIPWSNLRGKPVRVSIEDVFLLAAPREDADYDADEQDRRDHAVKMEKLDSAEMLKERNTDGMSQEEQQKNQSFTASLVTAIVDNVQVSVKNVHIRYEDSLSDPGHPFALGITLDELSAVSTDGNWKPTFIQSASTSAHKLATLGSLAVYWDTDAKLLCSGTGATQPLDHGDFVEKLRSMIVKGDSSTVAEHQFILKPVSGRAGLEMDKTGKADRPKIKARLLFDELGFIIDEDQYRDGLMLVDLFHYFIRHQEYKRLQPKSRPKEDPRAWLQFAGKAVLDKIHERNRKWSWDYFRERRDDRKRYIELFKKKKREEQLTQDETQEYDQLEHKLSYDDLRFWRSLARNQLRKENVGVKKQPQKQSWSSWIWGGGEQDAADDSEMSEKQRKELYDAIDWDEKKQITEAVDMPREYVKMQVEMSLRTGSFTLKRDPHGKATEILRLLFDSFSTKVLQRTDSMLAELSLDGMRLYDGTTEGSLFPQIVTVKDAPPVPDDKRIEELNDDETSKGDAEEEVADPFFQLSFENNPLDGSADTALTVKLKGMEVIYNPRFVVEVVKFFKPPESRMESIGALMETAGATLISSDDAGDRDLFQLKFVKVNKDSPEFMPKYEGIATNLDVHVSTINLIVTRATLLTLLDFVLNTFTSPGQPQDKEKKKIEDSPEDDDEVAVAAVNPDPDKIRIRAELKGISVILNNDGMRLATLNLSTADVGVFIMGKAMRVGGKLGSLSLTDDVNQGVSKESALRQLVTIEGDELLDFAYETFDADSKAYPGYDTSIYLRSGSIKVNFVTEPFRKIMEFGVKFGKMQAIFNAARQAAAEQASQVQERANKMHFDILIRTPIVVFPRMVAPEGQAERDSLTAHLGEIYANNKFVPLDDSKNADTANKLSAGLRNIRLTSFFHYEEEKSEELELIDKVDLGFDITYVEHKPEYKRPDLEIEGSMSNINLKLTQEQMRFMLELSRSIPAAFATDPEAAMNEDVERQVPDSTLKRANTMKSIEAEPSNDKQVATSQGPELGSQEEAWTKLDLVFKVGAIGLELINGKETEPVGDIEAASLSKFALNETSVKMRMLSDGSLESELLIQSFTIRDTRTQETNKFRKVMSLINNDVKQQFMASVSISGGKDRHMIVLLTIDSPRVILALDYLFAIQAFVNAGLSVDEPLEIESEEDDTATEDNENSTSDLSSALTKQGAQTTEAKKPEEESTMEMSFRINVVEAQAVLIANPAMTNSEAIVLGTKQVLISKQHATTLQVDRVGMFLCRMDQWETTKLRILDDFSIQTSLDMRSQGPQSSMTSIQVDIDPLVLRVSLRDIMLAMQIFNKASAMNSNGDTNVQGQEPKRIKDVKGGTKSAHAKSAVASTKNKQTAKTVSTHRSTAGKEVAKTQDSAAVKKEEMRVSMQGIRVVIIGDKHELPMLDWSVKKFDVEVRDWSGAMVADTSIDMFFNIYNFSKSAWEPLIEPWQLGFHMSKEQNPDKLAIELYSRKSLDLTVTAATIALASKSADFLSSDEDVLSKPRGTDAPYRIRNYTGFDMNVWAVHENTDDGSAAKLADGQEAPWRFEDPTTTRETLAPEGATGIVGIKLEGSGFDSINRIPVTREGEYIYNLQPRKDRILHRICVEVSLGQDNVKYITFRSPLVVENNTQIPVEIGVFSPEDGNLLKIEKVAPGDARPAPVGAAFMHSLIVRPDQGFGYTWSNERLFWKDLLKRPTRIISCRGESDNDSPPFYFQLHAAYDKKDPLTQVYPCMRLKLHAPVEVVNLLPYDFKYRIYDDNTKKDWTNFLRKGGVSPVHVVELSHLLLMSVDMQDTPFKPSKFSVINSSDKENFRREKTLEIKDNQDLALRLKLHYYNIPDSGGAFKVAVYSPYVVLNRTGLELDVRSKAFLGQAKAAAGAGVFANTQGDSTRAQPFMFSFPTDDHKNRALIKVGDTNWSKPQSFDAIGSTYDVALPSVQGRSEMHVGVTVEEGEGKYNLSKVVTIAPRYIIKNKMSEDINIREPGSSNILTLKNGDLLPLRYLRSGERQQLCLCFPGVNNQWSAPFDIANVGSVHVKLAKAGQRQKLIRVEILMEGGTIFLHVSVETKHWPFSMRNESDTEFLFWQTNPNVDEDEEDNGSGWRPVRYRLPPKSIMPYAWDYPAAKNKEIVLKANNKERHVKLAEIGNLVPLKLPPAQNTNRGKIIDLSVVADGPTQTLVISNWKPSKSLYKQKSATASRSTTDGFEVKDVDTDVTFKAKLRIAGIGISLVNRQLRELVYITLRDIELNYGDSALYQQFSSTIKWIQIDNQLYGGIFPILFYPSVVPKTGKEMEAHPILQASITRVKDDSYGVLYIKYFSFLLQQMTLEIDEDFIFALLDFAKIPGASWSEVKEGKLCEEELDIPEPKQEQGGQDVYFELLHLQPMQFDLSFVRTERINAEDTMTSSNPFMFAVNVLTMSIGNVNDAPLRYNALLLENARVSVAALVNNIKNHYVQESLRQVHLILGSADFLGNPVGLFQNVSSGVTDIFYEPYKGLVMTDRPQDLGIGIAKGASSFVKKSVFGFSDSMAKFTGSLSKGLAVATMDQEFQNSRRMKRSRNRPKHALYGITSGGNAFAESLASGIGGLARHPLQGAEKEGALGLVKGIGKGLLGVPTKAAIGAFDLASNMAEGVRNTTTVFDQEGLDRVRLSRFIGQDGIVRPYSQREALGQFWLKTLDNGRYFNEDYIAHLELPGKDLLVMLTYNGIMLVKTRKLTTEWDVPLKDIQTISKERTGMSITLKGGTNGPFIPVADEQSRNWLYKQVAVAVNAYNDKWNAKG